MNLLDGMRAFTRVVDAGGFAAAARDLGLARSVVHKQVIKLEQALGTQLLRRSTRQVSPTETGQAFYQRCVPILADVDAAIAQVSELQDEPRGELRINAPMSFGTLHLAPIVAAYMADYPDVHVELALNDRFVDPIEEGFDISIRISAPRTFTSLVTREICPVRLVLCASSDYLAAMGEPAVAAGPAAAPLPALRLPGVRRALAADARGRGDLGRDQLRHVVQQRRRAGAGGAAPPGDRPVADVYRRRVSAERTTAHRAHRA